MSLIENLNTYAEHFLKILTKENGLQPLRFNVYQKRLSNLVVEMRAANKPIRIIVLKARQLGISTWGTAHVYHSTATNQYTII